MMLVLQLWNTGHRPSVAATNDRDSAWQSLERS